MKLEARAGGAGRETSEPDRGFQKDFTFYRYQVIIMHGCIQCRIEIEIDIEIVTPNLTT